MVRQVLSLRPAAVIQTQSPSQTYTPPPSNNGRPPIVKIDRKNVPYRSVLSVDGGGLRGIIPLTILVEFEKKIKKQLFDNREILFKNNIVTPENFEQIKKGEQFFDIQLADFFDFVGGVSAGSIVASFLASRGQGFDTKMVKNGDMFVPGSAKLCRTAIIETAPIAFDKKWYRPGLFFTKFSTKGIDQTAKGMFSKNLLLSQVRGGPSLLVTSYKLDDSNADLFFRDEITKENGIIEYPAEPNIFYQQKIGVPKPMKMLKISHLDFELWQVVRSSAAAPTFFPSHELTSSDGKKIGTYADGGIITNNIDYIVMTYACTKHKIPVQQLSVLSLGCGFQNKNLAKGRKKNRGALFWIDDLVQILLNSALHVDVAVVSCWIYWYLMEEYPQYLRIQAVKGISPSGMQLPDIDDIDKIPDMIKFGEELATEYSQQLDMFIQKFILGIDKFALSAQNGSKP